MSVFVCNSSTKVVTRKDCFMSRNDRTWVGWLIFSLILLLSIGAITYTLHPLHAGRADETPSNLEELRDTLLADPNSVRGNWLRTLNPLVQDIQGDLVWNSAYQQGVMRIVDLPAPKPGSYYQLWIFDALKPADEAVSGAVLRQGSGRQELLAPIQATEHVETPYKFELHLEFEQQDKTPQVLLMVQP